MTVLENKMKITVKVNIKFKVGHLSCDGIKD
jgi:hypothetical protein